MMLSPSQSLGAAIVLSLCAYAVPVSAQTAQDPGAPVAPQAPRPELPAADVTAEEIRALADGVQGDAASQSRDSGQAQAAGAIGPSTASSSLNPDMSVILDVAAATYTHDPLTTGEHDPGDPGFTLQQLELHIGASVDPFFRLDGNIVYSAHGVELEEAFATTLALPLNFQLRAGQFLTRFGRLNSTHPHQWNFADQPLVLGKFFGSDGNRGVGVEASYLADLPWFAEVVFAAQGLTGDCCSRTYDATDPTPEDPEGAQSSPSVMWTGALKQFFVLSSNTSLLWGLSAQTAPQAPEGRAVILGSDLYLRWRPSTSDRRESLSLQVEGMWRHRHAPDAVPLTNFHDWGGYAQVVWGINALWEAGVRAEMVTGLANDPLDPDWTQRRTRYAAQATYYPTHFSRVRAQGIWGRAGWLNHDIVGALITLEILVGAHGAHTY